MKFRDARIMYAVRVSSFSFRLIFFPNLDTLDFSNNHAGGSEQKTDRSKSSYSSTLQTAMYFHNLIYL